MVDQNWVNQSKVLGKIYELEFQYFRKYHHSIAFGATIRHVKMADSLWLTMVSRLESGRSHLKVTGSDPVPNGRLQYLEAPF